MSFNIGLSGLRAVTEELNVISNNIANVNTAGFKSSRAEFSAIYSGGQAGGVEMSSVSQNFDRNGDLISSGRSMDLAISGSGFFVLSNNGEMVYSRSGMFQMDANNNIVSSNGMKLQGYGVNAAGQLVQGVVGDLSVTASNIPAQASTSVEFVANLKADASSIDITDAAYVFDPADSSSYSFSQSGKVYDSLGVEHTFTQYFVKTGDNEWRVHYYMDGAALESTPGTAQTQDLVFNTDGSLLSPSEKVSLSFTPEGANPISLSLDISKMSQYASDFNVTRNQSDGYTAGEMTGVRIESDGSLMAVFTNGQTLLQGQVVMADFANPSGLQQGDSTCWYQTFSSGQPTIGTPASGSMGTLVSGAYEGSNVDLTGELVNLMSAQRNYQANAKSLSAADQMTQILFNAF